jgi:regulator of nonsense transcripts 2
MCQIRDIAIPLDSAIAVNSRSHQLKNKAEQEQLKRLVLQNERRQGQSEMVRKFRVYMCISSKVTH